MSQVRPLYEEGERQIGNRFQATVRNAAGELVFACEHPHRAWEDAADCAYLWVAAKIEAEGLMPRKARKR